MRQRVDKNTLYKGMIIEDEMGVKGVVEECEDLHNVHIRYEDQAFGLYCFIEGCEENSEDLDPVYYDYRKEKLERIIK